MKIMQDFSLLRFKIFDRMILKHEVKKGHFLVDTRYQALLQLLMGLFYFQHPAFQNVVGK